MLSIILAAVTTGCANPWANDSAKLENQDSDAAVRIKAALIHDPRLAGSAIDVEIDDGRVVLTGFVETEEQSQSAIEVARRQQGVATVVNRITVK